MRHFFGDVHDLIFADKRHFDVNLCKFGLTVGAQVFVAETLNYLKVAIVAGDHQ